MELRHLRYFVAVAEELHFGRAARRLLIAQPALSAQIARLEQEFGVRLFDRDARRVALTVTGAALLAPARATLAEAAAASQLMRAHKHGDAGHLRVGIFINGAGELTTPILRAFEQDKPLAELTVHELGFLQQTEAVLNGDVDVAIVRPPYDEPGLDLVTVLIEPRVAVLADDHPLADRDHLSISDLLDEPFVCAHQHAPPAWRRYWLLTDQRGGRMPDLVYPDPATTTEWLSLIARNRGVGVSTTSIARATPYPGITYLPFIDDDAPSHVALATRAGQHAPLVTAFLDTALKVVAAQTALPDGAWLPIASQFAPQRQRRRTAARRAK